MEHVLFKRDAYGRGMWAFLNGSGESFEIVERDDGYITAAPSTSGYFAAFRHWPERQRQAIRFRRGDTALDVGCGAGRVALYLQERGYRVTGIDNSPLAVRTARKRGVKDVRVLPFQAITRLPGDRFDTIVMFGNNFGLFGSATKAKRLFRELRRITTAHAVVLAESLDPYATEEPVHLRYHRSNKRRGRMSGQIRIRIRYHECVGPWFNYLLVSPQEMEQVLEGSGWKAERFVKDAGPAYVAVITKL
jgi:SAM-dependent methyltransferase